MKKMTAILLLLLLCLTACGEEEPPHIQQEPVEEPVTLWLLTGQTQYLSDGSNGETQITYTYDNNGNLLTVDYDWGQITEAWDEEALVYVYDIGPFDGTVELQERYEYDNHGSIINIISEFEGEIQSDTTPIGCAYLYDGDGRLTACTGYVLEEGQRGTQTWQKDHHYDEDGALIRVDRTSEGDTQLLDGYTYDGNGLLTEACYYGGDLPVRYVYTYDEQGRVTAMTWSSFSGDDQDPWQLLTTTELVYDDDGKLLSRKSFDYDGDLTASVICTYTPTGKPETVCYFGPDGNLLDSFTYSHDLDGSYQCQWHEARSDEEPDVKTLIYNKNGDLIRIVEEDGDYTEYTYQSIQVTEEEARKYRKAQFLRDGIGLDGLRHSGSFCYDPGCEGYALIDYPMSSLYATDRLLTN